LNGKGHLIKPHYLSLKPFIRWQGAGRPARWREEFGRSAPLVVEIGFGLGDFLVRQAREEPEKDFVGLEVDWVPVRRALRKISLAGVPNVRVLKVDARVGLEMLFNEQSVTAAYSLFPCPWPKKRHAKHRLLSHDFLRLLNNRLVFGGETIMVTDHRPFQDWVLSQTPGTGFSTETELTTRRFVTKYERKWQAMGQEKFHLLRMTKREHMTAPIKEDRTMITHRISRFDPERFRFPADSGNMVVGMKEMLYDAERLKGMVRTVVVEDNLLQDFWIEIVKIDEAWRIRPAKGCGIIPTAGVQRALDLVRDAAAM